MEFYSVLYKTLQQVKCEVNEKTSQYASDGWFQSSSLQSAACCMVRVSEDTWGGKYTFSEVLLQWSNENITVLTLGLDLSNKDDVSILTYVDRNR